MKLELRRAVGNAVFFYNLDAESAYLGEARQGFTPEQLQAHTEVLRLLQGKEGRAIRKAVDAMIREPSITRMVIEV